MDIMILAVWLLSLNKTVSEPLRAASPSSNLALLVTSVQLFYQMDPQVLVQGTRLSWLMSWTSFGLKVTNPHDRVYAVLSMTAGSRRAGASLPKLIWPDYRRSLRDCMRDATRAMILEDQDLRIMRYTFLPLEGDNGAEFPGETWPSWTPVWHSSWPTGARQSLFAKYCADGLEEPALDLVELAVDADVLTLQGLKLGEVEHISQPLNMLSDSDAYIRSPREWEGSIKLSQSDLWMLLTAERYKSDRFVIDEATVDAMNQMRPFVVGIQETEQRVGDRFTLRPVGQRIRAIYGDRQTMLSSLTQAFRGRCVFRTSGSDSSTARGRLDRVRVGLAPANTQRGDCVAILFGSAVPFVLRPSENHWSLIGPCYV